MIAEFLLSAWFTGLLLGRYDTIQEMPTAEKQVAVHFAEATWQPLDPADAIDWFANKLALDKATRALLVKALAAEGKNLDQYRANMFMIANIENIRLLQAVQESMARALRDGRTFRDWQKDVGTLFANAGYEPENPWHLETIFRTNLFSAYNAGRYRQGIATADLLPYWQYVAVMDSRTRPSHARMNHFIARKDDPVWNTWFPPNGFNCRCTVRSLTEGRAGRESSGMPPMGNPDPGFEGNPGVQDPNGRQALEDLLTAAQKDYRSGWTDLQKQTSQEAWDAFHRS